MIRTLMLALALCCVSSAQAQTPPAGTAHQVTLGWQAPSPVGGSGIVAGYNVYRSILGAAFIKVNTALIVGLTTTDLSVASGQVDTYCATTVDSKGAESACSTTVTATIPTNPNPPVAPTVTVL
jgi:hypothetical protein